MYMYIHVASKGAYNNYYYITNTHSRFAIFSSNVILTFGGKSTAKDKDLNLNKIS